MFPKKLLNFLEVEIDSLLFSCQNNETKFIPIPHLSLILLRFCHLLNGNLLSLLV